MLSFNPEPSATANVSERGLLESFRRRQIEVIERNSYPPSPLAFEVPLSLD